MSGYFRIWFLLPPLFRHKYFIYWLISPTEKVPRTTLNSTDFLMYLSRNEFPGHRLFIFNSLLRSNCQLSRKKVRSQRKPGSIENSPLTNRIKKHSILLMMMAEQKARKISIDRKPNIFLSPSTRSGRKTSTTLKKCVRIYLQCGWKSNRAKVNWLPGPGCGEKNSI